MNFLQHWRQGGAFLTLLAMGMTVGAQSMPTYTVHADGNAAGFALEGVVQAVHQANIAAQTQGRVLELKVKAGDKVRAGQLLATLDGREAAIGAEKSQAQLAQAQAEWRNAQTQWERTRDLQQKGFVSKAALDGAWTQLQAAQAAKEQAGAATRLAGIAQGYTRVTAPFDGWVLQTQVQAGDLAVPGAPLVTLYAPQPLRAVVHMPHSRAVEARDASEVTINVGTDTSARTRLAPANRQIVPSADPVSQTTEWRWDLPAKESNALVPGQPLRVEFSGVATPARKATRVPSQAIVRRGELTAVYVAQGGRFVLRPVRTGARSAADSVEIIAGLREGDVVALDPVQAAAAR